MFLTAVEEAGIMMSCKADHNEVVVAGVHSVFRDLNHLRTLITHCILQNNSIDF